MREDCSKRWRRSMRTDEQQCLLMKIVLTRDKLRVQHRELVNTDNEGGCESWVTLYSVELRMTVDADLESAHLWRVRMTDDWDGRRSLGWLMTWVIYRFSTWERLDHLKRCVALCNLSNKPQPSRVMRAMNRPSLYGVSIARYTPFSRPSVCTFAACLRAGKLTRNMLWQALTAV